MTSSAGLPASLSCERVCGVHQHGIAGEADIFSTKNLSSSLPDVSGIPGCREQGPHPVGVEETSVDADGFVFPRSGRSRRRRGGGNRSAGGGPPPSPPESAQGRVSPPASRVNSQRKSPQRQSSARPRAVPRDIEGQSVRTERESILSRSVKITCNSSHRPYTSSDVIEGIKTVIELDKIEAVSSHGRNTEYYVTLYSKDDVDALLSEEILVKSWPAVCESLDRESFVVRVHWLPYWIDSSVITYNLGKHGKILKVFNETGATSDPDGRHIKTSIRRVVLQCRPGEKNKILLIVTVEGRDVLLTIKGRAPLCLKCHHTGHIRSACSTPYCRQCQAFGHCTEDCVSSSSYAAKVRPRVVAPEYVDDRVDPQDVMDVEVDEVPPGNHNIVSAVVSEPIREEQVVLGSPVIIPPPDTPDLDIGPSPVPSQCSGKRGPDDPEYLFEPSSLSEIRGITESPSDIDHVKRRRVGHSGRDSSPSPPPPLLVSHPTDVGMESDTSTSSSSSFSTSSYETGEKEGEPPDSPDSGALIIDESR